MQLHNPPSGEGGNIDLDEFYDHQNERPKILQDQHQGRWELLMMQLRPHPVIQPPGHFGAWQLKWWEEAELVFRKLQFPPGFDPPSLAFCASYNPFPFAKTLPIALSVGRVSLKRWNIMQPKTYFCDFFPKRSHHVQFQSGEKEPVISSDSINRVFPGFKILRPGVKWITNIWCDRFTRLWFIRLEARHW